MDDDQHSSIYSKNSLKLYKYPLSERIEIIKKIRSLSPSDIDVLTNPSSCNLDMIDHMIENAIGIYGLPLGIATNFIIDGKEYLIPMVTEESSVIAAASKAAKIAGTFGGFKTTCSEPIMLGQIQITKIPETWKLKDLDNLLQQNKQQLIEITKNCDIKLYSVGGGLQEIKCKEISTKRGIMFIIEFTVNVKNAMGANIINTMAEAFASFLQPKIPGKILLRIISNLTINRIATATAIFDPNQFGGTEIAEFILDAYEFAEADIFRASTHNKGIMNGISALTMATGNDTRAIEAGAHSYATISGKYRPLTKYSLTSDGKILGEITIPVPLGIIGGITNYHPTAKLALKILDIQSSEELGKIAAAVGLAQNFAALLALVSDGIQRGHMKLHARK